MGDHLSDAINILKNHAEGPPGYPPNLTQLECHVVRKIVEYIDTHFSYLLSQVHHLHQKLVKMCQESPEGQEVTLLKPQLQVDKIMKVILIVQLQLVLLLERKPPGPLLIPITPLMPREPKDLDRDSKH